MGVLAPFLCSLCLFTFQPTFVRFQSVHGNACSVWSLQSSPGYCNCRRQVGGPMRIFCPVSHLTWENRIKYFWPMVALKYGFFTLICSHYTFGVMFPISVPQTLFREQIQCGPSLIFLVSRFKCRRLRG
ncbi:uncharacterized protein LOC116206443 [Punica granatum]|uniref:Uncharacterized protein LOC116206443 n=1 Tax=Punica granatum TaxID=22663 RepID=A0A6P8DL97_PUNGR|nr:uncharacterized protein LOC116206443 [Punica granatum]